MTPSGSGVDGVVLRAAAPADRDLVLGLENAIFAEDPWTPAMIDEELSSPFSAYLLAVDDGDDASVVGYGGVRVVGETADIMTIGVLGAARGRRIGTRLLAALIEIARRAGAEEVFLEVRESNRAAIGLYESAGFEQIGRIRRYFRNPVEDAVDMRLVVSEAGPPARCD